MRHRMSVLLVAAWASLAALTSAFAADPIFPPGSRIGLVPPPGLTLSSKFNGFEDSAHGAAITLLDLPEPAYAALEQSAFANSSHLLVEKRELFPFHSGVGYLITGHEEAKGTTFRSWYLLSNTSNREIGQIAALIGVHVPETALAAYPDQVIRAALQSVTFRNVPAGEMLKLLAFQFKDMAGFRVMKVAPPNAAILIEGPSDDMAEHPYMIVSLGRGAPESPDAYPRFAHDMMSSAPIPDLAITSMEAMRIGGGSGFEVRAKAVGAKGEPLALVQWLRFGGGDSYLRVLGVVAKDRWDELFPRFRAVRDGIDVR
jgi:hypothetical protein